MPSHIVNIRSEDDIYMALSVARHCMKQLGFSELNQQKVLVSVSELTRNILDHAGGRGEFTCDIIGNGIQITVTDKGPGISGVAEILNGGKRSSSSGGLGLGLAGVNRLMDEFQIETSGEGTRIIATKWA